MRFLTAAVCAAFLVLAWYAVGRPQNPPGGVAGKFASLSFAAYGPGESPLLDRFPTAAEADHHMAVVAHEADAVRTYAAVEGDFDTAALARKHGLKVWQGIWLGSDRAKNDIEIARGIALAHKYPDTIVRVVVGNEVLLRRDLPPAELMADIDRVKAAVKQPVAYADVWEFWLQFPQVASHVDVMLIHLLPYWEDVPTGINGAVRHVADIFARMRTAFPGKQIAIGETGWPSRGRERADALPSLVNETRFLRQFMALSRAENFDYNFIEAFDQLWKYKSEGIVGANWGIFDAWQHVKIPLTGSVSNDQDWPWHAAFSVAVGALLSGFGLRQGRGLSPRRQHAVVLAGMAMGGALVFAALNAWQTAYDIHLTIAALVNVPGQLLLAVLAIMRLSGAIPAAPGRTGADATETVRALITRFRVPPAAGLFEDVCFLFVWTAAVLQMLLWCDGRYREFPLSSFAVPVLVTIGRLIARDLPLDGGQREELFLGLVLIASAVGSAILEGPLNTQSLVWNACAVVLALPPLLRFATASYEASART
ncbi:MAG TPA: glycoside hydrolase [Acetobacteraceae bacterium]|nr:glycoside hydrolase [Acetobacteraceae bacterium]